METYFGEIEEARCQLTRERILADLKALARDTAYSFRAMANFTSEKARAAYYRVAVTLERASSTINKLQTVVGLTAAKERTDTVIRDHPYQSIGIAFSVRLLAGLLAVRDKQDERNQA